MVVGIYAGLLGILLIVLSLRVVMQRRKDLVGLGVGDSPELEKVVRIQANFIEYVPITLIVIGLYEANGGHSWLVHLLGAALFLGRIAHAQGITQSSAKSPGRTLGMLLTWLSLLIGSICLLVTSLF